MLFSLNLERARLEKTHTHIVHFLTVSKVGCYKQHLESIDKWYFLKFHIWMTTYTQPTNLHSDLITNIDVSLSLNGKMHSPQRPFLFFSYNCQCKLYPMATGIDPESSSTRCLHIIQTWLFRHCHSMRW